MHYTFKTLGSFLFSSLLSIALLAQAPAFQDTIQKIDALFSKWNTDTPGGALTISRKGEIIYHKAFGMADLEHNLANTTETIFEAGSVSKQFTAAAILLLVQDGKLSLEDDVRKYVPEIPDYGVTIKIRHLMTHSSGLRDWGSVAGISGWERGKRVHTHAHVLEILSQQKALNFPPGDQFNYCNSGYNLMAIIVDRVSGIPFAAFCKQRIFEPLGLTHTQWRDDYRKVVQNRAIAYSKNGDDYLQNMPFEMVYGNGGLLTTTSDLIKWNHHYKEMNLGNKSFNELELTEGKSNTGVPLGYAAGLFIGKYNSYKEINHSGATAGYRAWLAYYPAQDFSVAFLSNDASANPGRIGTQVAALLLGERQSNEPMLGTIVPDEKTLQAKAGLYKSLRNDDMMQFAVRDGLLQFKAGDPLQATAMNTFFNGNNRMEFASNKFVLYTENGDSMTYVKKESFQPTEAILQSFMGTYHSEDADATYQVIWKDKTLQTFLQPDIYSKLTPLYKNAFENESGELLEFQYDKKGKITGFQFTTGRAWDIPFERIKG